MVSTILTIIVLEGGGWDANDVGNRERNIRRVTAKRLSDGKTMETSKMGGENIWKEVNKYLNAQATAGLLKQLLEMSKQIQILLSKRL